MSGCYTHADCKNGGKCLFDENDADFLQPGHVAKRPATCGCKEGFLGDFCQSGLADPTCKTDAECLNGGSCLLADGRHKQEQNDFLQPGSERAYCQCAVGFTGNKCHVRDYDIEIEYPARIINDSMEGSAIAGIALAAVVGIIAVFWLIVKGVGGSTREMVGRSRRTGEVGDGIAMTNSNVGLRKRRGATKNGGTEALDMGPVLTPSPAGEIM